MSDQNKSQFHKETIPKESEQQNSEERRLETEAIEHADTMDARVAHNLVPIDSKNEFIVVTTSPSDSQVAHDDDNN